MHGAVNYTMKIGASSARWENGKLSMLWRRLLAKDCALMEGAPPLLISHIVRVREGRGVRTLKPYGSVILQYLDNRFLERQRQQATYLFVILSR